MTPDAEQTRGLGLGEVQRLLDEATSGQWYVEEDERTWQLFAGQVSQWPEGTPADVLELFPHGIQGHPMQLLKAPKSGTPYAEYWPNAGDAALLAAAPDLARLALSLSAENAALARDVEQLRAQAGAVAKMAEKWAERARDLEKRVPMPMVDDRDAHVLGRSGGLESCAKDLLTLLNAQASAEGEGQERGEG